MIERDVLEVAEAQQLCAFGQRLLDLDAEDFGQRDAARDANTDHHIADLVTGDAVPDGLVARSRAARMPQSPREADRGALATLRPAFGLMLEAISIRWLRSDTSALVAAVHTASEYLPLLMWESVLGHAADPDHMPESVGGAGSRWGEFNDPECPQTKPQKSAAERSLRVAAEPDPGWRAYLDRQHSVVAEALTTCATHCRTPCTVVTRHSEAEQHRLAIAGRLADEFTASAIVRLRHSSPVGHAFGVPSAREVTEAWVHTRATLGAREPAMLVDDGFCLAGLPSLFSCGGRRADPADDDHRRHDGRVARHAGLSAGVGADVIATGDQDRWGANRMSRRLLATTNRLDAAIAAAATIGVTRPAAASGIAATL